MALNCVFAFGAFGGMELGLAGIGLATTVVDIALFIVFGLLTLKAMRGQYVRVASFFGEQFRAILRIGVPTASIFFIETSMFSGMLFVVGQNDTDFLAVLGLIFQYETMAMMVPIGLSQAMVQRVSVAATYGSATSAKLLASTQAGLLVIVFYLLTLGLIQFGFQVNFPSLFIIGAPLDASILSSLETTQMYAFAVIVFHAFVILIAGILRGLEDVQASLLIVLICYWGVGLGLGVVLIEVFNSDASISIGIVAFAMLLSFLSILFRLKDAFRHTTADHSGERHE